jgi:hypothetical protein
MRLLIGLVTALVLCLASSGETKAQELSSIELLRHCNAAVRQADAGNLTADEQLQGFGCFKYLAGFLDGYVLAASMSEKGFGRTLCPPPTTGIESEQAARIVAKWLKENPEQLHQSARISVLIALGRAFPCED